MEVILTTSELEFRKWFPEIDSRLWKNFKIRRIRIEVQQGKEFEYNPMAPAQGTYRVHVTWSGKNFDDMRNRLHLILRATMYGNFADTYTNNVKELLEEIRKIYPNSTLQGRCSNYDYWILVID